MKFGVCGDTSLAVIAGGAAYDYMEWNVGSLLKPRESDEAFRAVLETVQAAPLRFSIANGFVPGDLKITGPDVDIQALQAYVTMTMERAAQAGVEIIVFGSGGARQIPQDFSRQVAHEQLVAFCSMAGRVAHDHGVTIAVEPLNQKECNVLTTVSECAELVNEVAHPAIRLLADAYHMMRDGDPNESIVTHGALLAHVHIATCANRLPPGAEDCDLNGFFDALAKAHYTGRISIEGKIKNPETELPAALTMMRTLAGV